MTRPSPELAAVDFAGFAREIRSIRARILPTVSRTDFEHLRRVERWGRICTAFGYATAWIFVNPLSALLISQGNLTRWMLMHHIGHGGYDRVPGVPWRYTSQGFAAGRRRFVDWLDWIAPDAWKFEHNILHHLHTGDRHDPDLVERLTTFLRVSRLSRPARYLVIAGVAVTWKIVYYAPNTLFHLQQSRAGSSNAVDRRPLGFLSLFNPFSEGGAEFWRRCLLPYGFMRFVVLPAAFLPLGWTAAGWVLANSILAEALTNLHSFLIVAPNHCGEDVYRFDETKQSSAEYYARQVLGSVNYATGTDTIDFSQAWLNYQIEHHLWPDVPLLKYRQLQPQTKALCEAYGLPYTQERVFTRAGKLLDVMAGRRSMKRVESVTARA